MQVFTVSRIFRIKTPDLLLMCKPRILALTKYWTLHCKLAKNVACLAKKKSVYTWNIKKKRLKELSTAFLNDNNSALITIYYILIRVHKKMPGNK